MIEGIKNWNASVNKSETWSWKYRVGIEEGIVVSPLKGLAAQESRGELSHQSGSRRLRERSCEFAERLSVSLNRRRHHSAVMGAMSRVLRRAARSPFSDEIEHA